MPKSKTEASCFGLAVNPSQAEAFEALLPRAPPLRFVASRLWREGGREKGVRSNGQRRHSSLPPGGGEGLSRRATASSSPARSPKGSGSHPGRGEAETNIFGVFNVNMAVHPTFELPN